MQGPRIPAVERMGSVVACRTVGNGTEGGSRDQNPTAILMLDRVQLETGGIGKEGLNMARGSSHLVLTIEHFWHSMFWVHLSDQTCTEVAGEPRNDPGLLTKPDPGGPPSAGMITPSLPAVCGLRHGVSCGTLYPSTSGSFLASAEAIGSISDPTFRSSFWPSAGWVTGCILSFLKSGRTK